MTRDALQRRRLALAVLLSLVAVSALLRALPHALPPAVPATPACLQPQVIDAHRGAARQLSCDSLGEAPSGAVALLLGIRLDVNLALETDLQALPGIGDRLAKRIVDDRRLRGRFETISALARVRGVGPKTVEKLKAYLSVQ